MAKQTISIGTTANDGTGDTLRDAFDKANDNFTELYTLDAADLTSGAATDGQVLTADGAGGAAWEDAVGGDLVDDTTPQLGGDLDLNGSQITGSGGTITTSQPILDVSQTWNDVSVPFTGIKANITDTASAAASLLMDLQVNTSSKFKVAKNGHFTAERFVSSADSDQGIGLASAGYYNFYDNAGNEVIRSGGGSVGYRFAASTVAPFGWSSTSNPGGALGVGTYRDADQILAQRNTTNAQTYRLYNTYTDASNYERLTFTWDSNVAKIQTEAAGTGTLRVLQLGPMYTATLKSGVPVTAVTTTASPAATDTGTVYNNIGDSDGATITLPSCAAGLQFTVCVMVAQTLTVTAGSGDVIRIASNVTAAAGSITSSVIGSSVTLIGQDNETWFATSAVGSWTI